MFASIGPSSSVLCVRACVRACVRVCVAAGSPKRLQAQAALTQVERDRSPIRRLLVGAHADQRGTVRTLAHVHTLSRLSLARSLATYTFNTRTPARLPSPPSWTKESSFAVGSRRTNGLTDTAFRFRAAGPPGTRLLLDRSAGQAPVRNRQIGRVAAAAMLGGGGCTIRVPGQSGLTQGPPPPKPRVSNRGSLMTVYTPAPRLASGCERQPDAW